MLATFRVRGSCRLKAYLREGEEVVSGRKVPFVGDESCY